VDPEELPPPDESGDPPRLEPGTPAAPADWPACHSEAEIWPSRLVSNLSKLVLRSGEPWASLLEIMPSPLLSRVPNWDVDAVEPELRLLPGLPILPAAPLTSLPVDPLWLLEDPVPIPLSALMAARGTAPRRMSVARRTLGFMTVLL